MSDDDLVRGLWSTMAEGWAAGDAARFAAVFGPDVDFVTVRGEDLRGRAAVEEVHARLFASAFRDTRLVPNFLLVRPLADGVHLVHVTTGIVPLGVLTHAQAVVTRRDGGWEITAFHNMIPNAPRGTTP
ncbi:SgcJ/EcaC family oxidoreductase [Umezawaea endophytica]|uniref:SgcJ/EcaC family oxidoreductase n=1 Tax=Umezawaea endophytica TaxID=1654476 RepID=A0A9X3AHK7_9PSEU|nr:SgcJ/EcaC family oxidoreductase [Umezawaea endophytica]MCS7479535.1 SgcJ/EcaC family oxidoreductase [Umezawaea endophytica]